MVTFVPTPIGNLEDITLRALKALEAAQTVFCEDTRVTGMLFKLLNERHGCHIHPKRYISLHAHNEAKRLQDIDPALFGEPCVYVSDAGMPGISDPGEKLLAYCIQKAIPYDILPGPSAVLPGYLHSGFGSGRFLFYGFLPHKGKERSSALESLLGCGYDVVLYESPHRLMKLANDLAGMAPERTVSFAKELSKKHQQVWRGSAKEVETALGAADTRGEWVVVLAAGSECIDAGIVAQAIAKLDVAPKEAAKAMAAITGKSTKACYETLAHLQEKRPS